MLYFSKTFVDFVLYVEDHGKSVSLSTVIGLAEVSFKLSFYSHAIQLCIQYSVKILVTKISIN